MDKVYILINFNFSMKTIGNTGFHFFLFFQVSRNAYETGTINDFILYLMS